MIRHKALVAGLLLGTFGVVGSALVAFTHEQTADRIAANEREAQLRLLSALVPPQTVDNDLLADQVQVHRKVLLGSASTTVYRGRLKGEPVAAVFTSVVPDGYSGPIKLLVAVRRDGTLGGVRVISQKETPGLGDRIEASKSDWIYGFTGKSLTDPPIEKWGVKRDGGYFDQFSGATITPRAVVRAIKNTLIYYRENADTLFQLPAAALGKRQERS